MIDQFSSSRNNNKILLLYGYTFLFALIRGSGFDLFILAFIAILPLFLILQYFFNKKNIGTISFYNIKN